MKKVIKLLGMATVAALSLSAMSCNKNNGDVVKKYNLTIIAALPQGVDTLSVSELNVNAAGVNTISIPQTSFSAVKVDDANTNYFVTFKGQIPAGTYNVSATGKFGDTKTISGSLNVELYADKIDTVKMTVVNISPIIFKSIYNAGGKQYYAINPDTYVEIVNNSDEVQYLDGLILSSPTGNQKSANAWQAHGFQDVYECGQGTVLAFPGTGKDYPLQPGKSITIANTPINHKTLGEGYENCPDLSNADWQIYLPDVAKDRNIEGFKNLEVIYINNKYMTAWGLGFMGRSYLIAKLPEGMTPATFASDPKNLMTTPGTTSTMQYLMIPSKYVIDAVDIYNPESTEHYPTFLPSDDLKGVAGAQSYSGKCLRRKVVKIENNRPYYKDTNNSEDDFLIETAAPGAVPQKVD